MPELKKIEIICLPCHKCEVIRQKIQTVLHAIGNSRHMHMNCEFVYYTTRKEAMAKILSSGYDLSKTPVTLINGQVAFTGSRISEQEIRIIIEGILKY